MTFSAVPQDLHPTPNLLPSYVREEKIGGWGTTQITVLGTNVIIQKVLTSLLSIMRI